MLNEFIEINPMLKALGCDLGESHPSFKRCPKKKGFIIFLDQTGHIEDVDIPAFGLESVYRWQKGKKDPAFPVFNARAFFEVTCDPSLIPTCVSVALKEKDTKKSKKKVEASSQAEHIEKRNIDEHKLQAFIAGCSDLWKEDLTLIGRSLNELPFELLRVLEEAEEKPESFMAFKDLVKRAGLCHPEKFCEEARKIFINKLLDTGKKEFAEGLFALKKKGKKGRGKEHGRDFLYLLTIKDWDKPEYGKERFPPYHSIFQSWMARIFEQHGNESCKPIGKKDAFGLDMAGAEDHYDDVNAAGLGQIKLFAANEDIPCLKRYGLEGVDLFPAGRNARETGRKSLEYILDQQREGTTWRSLRKYENRNAVAFAYCTRLTNAKVIQIFDDDDISGQDNIYISEEATKTALKTLEGIVGIEPAAEIVIGIIAALDKGNVKVLASRRYPLTRYISGAVRWQKGCVNIPDVVLPWLQKKDNLIRGALSVYPTRVIWLLNSAWRQNGEMITRKKVPISKRFISSDALDFLFESDGTIRDRVDAGLENIVEKSVQTLIMAKLTTVINQSRKGEKLKFNNSVYLHMLPTLYGLLLYKKGIRKEAYMKEEVFYLGRFFAVVDKLHIQYSLDVRNGEVPVRLIGNDHVSLALQNPLEAFISLGHRLEHPYISWAKRVSPDTIPRRAAKNCLKDIAALTNRLTGTEIPNEIDNAGKAKLILGYLSYGAKDEEAEQDNSNIDSEYNNKEGKDHE
ncbi:hypothetical protein PITCH_A190122 [uncultured Desulfobacterium sp.]|uniref:Uncharacterized protein n=1 Tax=uncultured Desulfobacterium sp. TaxID=201089 RepID=A0A445MVP8_9BACT|nr:hypothetical protein PITCH_A190122 [uncultured Desulfobacterium sp.]